MSYEELLVTAGVMHILDISGYEGRHCVHSGGHSDGFRVSKGMGDVEEGEYPRKVATHTDGYPY